MVQANSITSIVSPKFGKDLLVSLSAVTTFITSLFATQLSAESHIVAAAPFGPQKQYSFSAHAP